MIVRDIKIADLPQVMQVCEDVRNHHIDLCNGYFKPLDRDIESSLFLGNINKAEAPILVAQKDDKIVGVLLSEMRDASYLEKPRICNVSLLGVLKEYRGLGIGKALLKELSIRCKLINVDEIKLTVYSNNPDAYRFYEEFGFKLQEYKMNLKV